jgi:metal-responsive CopG/Arc/MetJ family transcriptional regulator
MYVSSWKEGMHMSMARVIIQVPKPLKAKLDALRAKGYTASGFIRAVLERELNAAAPATGRKGR